MTHYSILPEEMIWAGFESINKDNQMEIQIGGATMIIEQTSQYEGKIHRLLSPNPHDYLDATLAPGAKITFKPTLTHPWAD